MMQRTTSSKKSNMKGKSSSNNQVAAPAALGRTVRTMAPSMKSQSGSDGRIRVSHREYIADVTVQSSFTAVSYSVNPGIAATFAWLSNLAQNYESYCFNSLSFVIETQCPTSTAGSIQMAIDYDAADASPSTKQALMSYHNAVRSPAWGDCRFVADRQDLLKFGSQRFIRTSALSANQDIKTYDVGNLWVATSGGAGVVAGELYVEYDVELMTPQTGGSSGVTSKVVANGSISKTAIFGATPTVTGSLVSAVSSTLTFPNAGHYMVNLDVVGTSVTLNPNPTGTASAVVNLAYYGIPTAPSELMATFSVVTSSVNQTLIFDCSGSSAVTASTCRIIRDSAPDFAAI